uniref:Uncharacterized protein n=1 Tax=Bionectria ochroleuca TaxID=29856 RepID=A0A8H7K787_BIOOC
MILDAAWHLTDALYPARQPEYIYKSRPFWWWHFYKDLDLHTQKFRNLTESHELPIRTQLSFAEDLDFSLSHALADFPAETFEAVTKAIDRELSALCPLHLTQKRENDQYISYQHLDTPGRLFLSL